MRARFWMMAAGLCAATGCSEAHKAQPANDGSDAGQTVSPAQSGDAGEQGAKPTRSDASTEEGRDSAADCRLPPPQVVTRKVDKVDVLFMVDNSPSMQDEQENLAKNLPLLVESLASGKLKSADGKIIRQFPPAASLHLGVISSNLGINGAPTRASGDGSLFVPKTSCDGLGDDGLLLQTPSEAARARDATCTRQFPSYLEYPSEDLTPRALGQSFACVAMTGSGGCGFEQQLEATWKALAPRDNHTFSRGTSGHGDDTDFLRADSVLAIILVSDEEDSSIPDSSVAMFDVTQGDKARVNLRQYVSPALLHPVSRFIDGFKSLRPSDPDLVSFTGIVGVPLGSEALMAGDAQDFDAILKLPEMQFMEAPPTVDGVVFASEVCAASPTSRAYPAPRMVQVAKGFGKNGTIHSICDTDFSGALTTVVDKIGAQLEITVGGCKQDSDCPTDWACVRKPEASVGQCVNPVCSIQ